MERHLPSPKGARLGIYPLGTGRETEALRQPKTACLWQFGLAAPSLVSKAYEPPARIIHGQVHPEVTKVTFSLWVLQISLALGSACRIFSFAACATSGFSHSWSASFDAIWKIPSGNHLADRMSQHSWPAWPSLWVPTHCVPGWSQRSSLGTSVVPWA